MTNEVATTDKPKTLQELLARPNVKGRFEQILGKKAPGFLSSILSVTNGNKALRTTDPNSIISAAAIAASLDLPINPSLGFAYIVPYANAAQFQIGWKGIVQLALRTGQYETINATEVYEGQLTKNDSFTGEMEFKEKRTSDKIAGYLLFFKLSSGFRKYVYWTREKCEAHAKKYSQTYKKGFGQWAENFDAMALKTVVKNGLSKWGILSIEMQTAFQVDQAVIKEDGTHVYVDAASAEITGDSADGETYAMPQSTETKAVPYSFTGSVKTVTKTELNNKKVLLARILDDATKTERKVYVEASDFMAEAVKDATGKRVKVTFAARDGAEWFKGIEEVI